MFETLLLLKANVHIITVYRIVTSNLCILNFKYNREQVFCILDLWVEVFDKSISNAFTNTNTNTNGDL